MTPLPLQCRRYIWKLPYLKLKTQLWPNGTHHLFHPMLQGVFGIVDLTVYLGNGAQIVARFHASLLIRFGQKCISTYFREMTVLYIYSSLGETCRNLKRKIQFRMNAIEALSRADSQVSWLSHNWIRFAYETDYFLVHYNKYVDEDYC